jgi:hypothetical protein
MLRSMCATLIVKQFFILHRRVPIIDVGTLELGTHLYVLGLGKVMPLNAMSPRGCTNLRVCLPAAMSSGAATWSCTPSARRLTSQLRQTLECHMNPHP